MSSAINPLLAQSTQPFQLLPFTEITEHHFLPALQEAFRLQNDEIAAILQNDDKPNFANTVEAFERSGAVLAKICAYFFHLNSCHRTDGIDAITDEFLSQLSQHEDSLLLNNDLFKRIESVYNTHGVQDKSLSQEQRSLLDKQYKLFIRSGAQLEAVDKQRMEIINQELTRLTTLFSDNLLKASNEYQLFVHDESALAGLPESLKNQAKERALAEGRTDCFLFTTQKACWIPFVSYASNRALRQELYQAMYERANGGEFDNNSVVTQIVNLRIEKAHLLGFACWADYILDDSMAKTQQQVNDLLEKIWQPALKAANREQKALEEYAQKLDNISRIESWDWWYYTEKIRQEKFALDQEELKPYFALEAVMQGSFDVVTKLYGLTFHKRDDLPKFHPECQAYEVKDGDQSLIGIFYVDYTLRKTKREGAWMNALRKQQISVDGKNIRPIIMNTCNYNPSTKDTPCLLTFEQVTTLFHELGHALHGLLSQCHYSSLSGTDVVRDFVELPSQIMEHWASEPQVLKSYAKHWQTGEVISDDLIAKMQAVDVFNQGFKTVEYLAASQLDLAFHSLTQQNADLDPQQLEKQSMQALGLPSSIIPRYRCNYFQHVFADPMGYSAGYYSYIWAEVLEAHAYESFTASGDIFDQNVATSFRKNILEKGATEEGMALYMKFKGCYPDVDHLLKQRGL